jgi:hypothetical protein
MISLQANEMNCDLCSEDVALECSVCKKVHLCVFHATRTGFLINAPMVHAFICKACLDGLKDHDEGQLFYESILLYKEMKDRKWI